VVYFEHIRCETRNEANEKTVEIRDRLKSLAVDVAGRIISVDPEVDWMSVIPDPDFAPLPVLGSALEDGSFWKARGEVQVRRRDFALTSLRLPR
jgi:hypothetical protein